MGGGSSNSAQDAANQAEKDRQAQIAASTASINSIFSDPKRQAQYSKLQQDTTNYYTGDLNRQNTIAQRNLKFALARSGLVGGSQQAAEGTQLSQDYDKGLLQASNYGQQAAANLRNQDETTRNTLLGLAQSGADTSTISQQASLGLQNNLLSGQGTATANQLGDAFSNFNDIYQQSQDRKAARNTMLYGYGSLYSPTFGPGAGYGGYGGFGGNGGY